MKQNPIHHNQTSDCLALLSRMMTATSYLQCICLLETEERQPLALHKATRITTLPRDKEKQKQTHLRTTSYLDELPMEAPLMYLQLDC